MEIINRKAKFDYFTYETYEAGIVLTGTEIKSIRNGKANIKDSYAIIRGDEAYLLNTHISLYKEGSSFNHEEQRTRKLLLHKKEILKIKNKLDIEGYTLIPLKMYFKGEKLKVLLGVCKGKKNYDKKQSLKERDIMREVNRNLK
ncbi:MAG: SsrA-binding protein SmpB [Tenericutes bacterium]|nr:SsrA-binding protein SmpB [Mycoplasmatota bacterium]